MAPVALIVSGANYNIFTQGRSGRVQASDAVKMLGENTRVALGNRPLNCTLRFPNATCVLPTSRVFR